MRTLVLIFIFIISFLGKSNACSIAIRQNYFCEIGQHNNYDIIRGKIVKKLNNGIKIKVYEVYRGEATEKEITIWDNSDWDCNGIIFNGEAINMGDIGQTIVAYITQITEKENTWEKIGDYRNTYTQIEGFEKHKELNYNLVQKGNKIKGPISDGNWSVSLEKLAVTLRDCLGETVHETPIMINEKEVLKVYPNPTKDYLFISNDAESADVSIYNMNGQIVASKTIFIAEEGIQVSHLTSGVYICLAKIEGVIFRQKFIVFQD